MKTLNSGKTLVLAASAVFFGLAGSAFAQQPPMIEEAAMRFCQAQIAGDSEGVKNMMTPELRAVTEAFISRNSGPAAMIPLLSNPMEVSACQPAPGTPDRNLISVPVSYQTKSGGQKWSDTLVLRDQGGTKMIDDIVFSNFSGRGPTTLRALLQGN